MRLPVVCGSLQRASANRAALDVVTHLALGRDVDVVVSHAVRHLPPLDTDLGDGPAVVAEWRASLAAADAVAVAGPEYAGGVAGALKNAFDWIVGSGELYGRAVGVLIAGTSGGVHARRHLIQSLTWQGAHVVADLGIAAPRAKVDASGVFVDPATLVALEAWTTELLDMAAAPIGERIARAVAVVAAAGVESGHVAPVGPPGTAPA